MQKLVLEIVEESIQVKRECIESHLETLIAAAERLSQALKAGGKILIFGNGGSAADAQHIAAEFVNRYQMDRPPLPAIALTTDTSIITSIANDFSFDEIFSKQIRALGRKTDVAIGISTSGNSENVVQALSLAREAEIFTIGLTGRRGGRMGEYSDLLFAVPSDTTARIQETHILIGHLLCDLTDRILYGKPGPKPGTESR